MTEEKLIRLHPDDLEKLAGVIVDSFKAVLNREDQFLNLKELSKAIGIKYNTLARKKLPYHKTDRSGRKLYKLKEIMAFLDIRR